MSAGVFNPHADKERMFQAKALQDRAIKLMTSKKTTKITLKEGEPVVFDKPCTIGSEGFFYIVFVEEDKKIFKFPIETIKNIEETIHDE